MTKQNQIFGLMLGGLALIFAGMIGYQEYLLETGELVVLKTAPVDPRDVFRGDYVILSYEISDQASERLVEMEIEYGENVYVVLNTSASPATVQRVTRNKPKEDLYITGQVSQRWGGEWMVEFPSLSQYYVPEGQGRALERMRGEDLFVEVSVNQGRARIINLLDKNQQVIEVSDLE